MASQARRFLAVGLDGATFDLLDPLMAAGDLPFLKSLQTGGVRARLRSVFPPKTIPAWYSFATGLDPGALGVFGFTEPDGGPGRSRVVPTYRPAEALWDRLSRLGHPVGVLNFPVRNGHPVFGFIVPGMLTEEPTTYPEALKRDMELALQEPFLFELPLFHETNRGEWIDFANRAVAQHVRHAEYLIERFRPEFLFVLIRETDRIQHALWDQLEAPVERIPEDLRAFYRGVDRACAQIDRAFRSLGDPLTTLILSDHGHGAAHADFFTNRWLEREGYLVFQGDAGRTDWRRLLLTRLLLAADRFGLSDRLLKPLADRLRGPGARERVNRLLTGELSFEALAPQIDWQRTVAYSYPVPEGIYLNPHNPSLTEEKRGQVVAEIRHRLESLPGARVEVLEPRAIYRGGNLDRAPALFLRVNDLATETRMDFSYPEPMLASRPRYFYGAGVHRMDGIFLLKDDEPRRGEPKDVPTTISLLDVAPTILESMGVDVPASMHGRSVAREAGLVA